jgi:hypothetical protein
LGDARTVDIADHEVWQVVCRTLRLRQVSGARRVSTAA